MDVNGIKYRTVTTPAWISMWDKSKNAVCEDNPEAIGARFDCCKNFCKAYVDGKIYYCMQAYGANLGVFNYDMQGEYLDLFDENTDKIDILEYLAGFLDKGYMEVCKHCKGWGGDATEAIPVAEQL